MPEQLPERYKKDYELKDGTVIIKNDYKFKSTKLEREIVITKEHIIVNVVKEGEAIKNLCKKVSHAYILLLKEKHKIEFDTYDLIADPNVNKDGHGYVRISIKDSNIIGDGEVVRDSLPEEWQKYAFTILYKRAEDRAIAQYLGLYSEGFLTESEILPETESTQYDDLEIGKVEHSFKDNSNKEVSTNVNNNSDDGWSDIILLLTRILKVNTKDFVIDIKSQTGYEDLYYCNIEQKKKLATYYEKKFGTDEQLREVLINYVKDYAEVEKWSKQEFEAKIKDILKVGDLMISKMSIDDCYDIILDLGIHS